MRRCFAPTHEVRHLEVDPLAARLRVAQINAEPLGSPAGIKLGDRLFPGEGRTTPGRPQHAPQGSDDPAYHATARGIHNLEREPEASSPVGIRRETIQL